MYKIETSAEFDSAHFLKDYDGKCANIHGHRWLVRITVKAENVKTEGQERGMVTDFSTLKKALKEETRRLDHSLIIEEGSLRENTLKALGEEGFRIITFPGRPTAEMFAKHFYDHMKDKGYDVESAEVYETPRNKAVYTEE